MSRTKTRITYFHVAMYLASGRRLFRGDVNSPVGFLRLTTVGRRTGKRRTSDLLYLRDGADYVLTASYGGGPRNPGWFFNATSNPDVTIEVQGVTMRAVAELANSEKRKELWARLVKIAPLYLGYEKRTRREIPMLIIHPVAEG